MSSPKPPPPPGKRELTAPRRGRQNWLETPLVPPMPEVPAPPLPPTVPTDCEPFDDPEPDTGRRNPNVSLMQELIGVFDELDDLNRELLVSVACGILRAQTKRKNT